MHNLAGCMHSRIGSPGCKGLDRSMRIQLGDGCFQFGLDAVTVALSLPTAKSRTLVLQTECDPLDERGL